MSNKRNFNDNEEDDSRRFKRLCSSEGNGSHSVQLTLNQLLKLNSLKEMTRSDAISYRSDDVLDKNCFNCRTNCKLVWISCNFCEKYVCEECCLKCYRCLHTFCRLCAVKSYQFSHQNNVGLCLSCSS